MRIAIRKELNGLIYIDKNAIKRFDEQTLKQSPYNFNFVEVDKEDCEACDFNDDLSFNIEKYNKRKENNKFDDLRRRREAECFPIINRGQWWYDTLTEKQKVELKEWYSAWLNVTDTLIIPNKPNWI